MNNYETFKSTQENQEIKNAHEIALHAEKVSRKISKQALRMVGRGETYATAKRTLGEAMNPIHLISDAVSSKHDSHSIELATNARLREEGVEVEIVPPERDVEMVLGRADVRIKKIDGETVDRSDR